MKNFKLYAVLFGVGIFAFILLKIDSYLYKMVFLLGMTIVLCWLLVKEIVSVFPYFVSYMLSVQLQNFDKKIEKPRLLFYFLFGSSAIVALVLFYKLENNTVFYQFSSIIQILMFTLSVYLLYFTWSNAFVEDLIPQLQKKIFAKSNYFEIGWNKDELKEIFNRLNENDFIEILIDYEVLDFVFFSDKFVAGEIPKEQPFKLNMDNVQTKYFFDLFSSKSTAFTLDDFLCFFTNKNGIAIRGNIESSYSKSKKNPKQKDVLDKIFDLNT